MIPEVSAGSNQVGTSETCTAHVICPSGAAPTGKAAMATISRPRSAVQRARVVPIGSLLTRSINARIDVVPRCRQELLDTIGTEILALSPPRYPFSAGG